MRALRVILGATLLASSGAALCEPETGTRFDRKPMAVTDSANDPVVSKVVNRFARCVANSKPQWADGVLAMQFLSEEQMRAATKGVSGLQSCFGTSQFDLKFSSLSLLGGLAEQRIAERFGDKDVSRLSAITDEQLFSSAAAPKTTTDDFAMCIARKDPVTVRRLIASEPITSEETQLIQSLVPHLSGCLPSGLNIKLNKQTIRVYSAVGLHHLLAHEADLAPANAKRK